MSTVYHVNYYLCVGDLAIKKLLETPGNILRYCQLRNMELSLDEYVEYRFNNELLKMNMYESTP